MRGGSLDLVMLGNRRVHKLRDTDCDIKCLPYLILILVYV